MKYAAGTLSVGVVLLATSIAACENPQATLGRLDDDFIDPEDIDFPELPDPPYNYEDHPLLPHFYFLAPVDNTPVESPVTNDGATLGRVLFYDRWISAKGTVRCASCHEQSLGFAGSSPTKVHLGELSTERNPLPLFNLRWVVSRSADAPADGESGFFWDGRAPTLESAIEVSLDSQDFVGAPEDLIARIEKLPYYAPLFEAAFGDGEITKARVVDAIAQYLRAIISDGSRLENAFAQIDWASGASIVESLEPIISDPLMMSGIRYYVGDGGCSSCHGDLVTPYRHPFANNGLDEDYADPGLFLHTGQAADDGVFRVPNLRNLTLRSRMMHDGRFASIRATLEHYASGVKSNPNLSEELVAHEGLDPAQIPGLEAAVQALEDDALRNDPRFSDPFPDSGSMK